MAEILQHLGCKKPCKQWDKVPIIWLAGFQPSTVSSWWFQPIWICSSKWVHLPQFSGWKFQKSLSCHHLEKHGQDGLLHHLFFCLKDGISAINSIYLLLTTHFFHILAPPKVFFRSTQSWTVPPNHQTGFHGASKSPTAFSIVF